ALAVQIVVGNLPGALACYLLLRATRDWDETEKFAPTYRWVLIAAMVFLGMVSLLVLAANIRLWTS
ncbi:MAG: cell shape determination protein CcmA, partial [Rothia dentocariosa]|nr:cell shape determination protein CcmA [Rothia dentocariosa]